MVSGEDRRSFEISLKQLREYISQNIYCNVFISPCHLTNGLINLTVEHVQFLFTLEDVQRIIGDSYTAQMVLEELADFFEDFDIDIDSRTVNTPVTLKDLDPFWDSTAPLDELVTVLDPAMEH